jgi:serine/threonine-protein kinase PknG
MEELRYHALGVLRETVGITRGTPATTSAPSELFDPPTVVSDVFTWRQFPQIKPDHIDPHYSTLASLDSSHSAERRYQELSELPTKSTEVLLALSLVSLELGRLDMVATCVATMLAENPLEWRAAWVEGLAALNSREWEKAQRCFNAVYGQVPGELGPKFALAVACEMGGDLPTAEILYHICTVTGSGYVAGAAFGLARVRAKTTDTANRDGRKVVDALNLVPSTSGGFTQSRRLAATYLTQTAVSLPELETAYRAMASSPTSTQDRLELELEIFTRALPLAATAKQARKKQVPSLGGVPLVKTDIRAKISSILRDLARRELDPVKRNQLIDQANSMRKWTIL